MRAHCRSDSFPPGPQAVHPVGLSYNEERRLKQKLRRRSPSEPWVEAQFKTIEDIDFCGNPIVYRYHDPHVFPPGGAKTRMVRCPKCGVFNPPNAMEHGACLDHARHEGWGISPSVVAFIYLQKNNIDQNPIEMLPEDVDALRAEIEQYQRKSTAPQSRRGFDKSQQPQNL